jgi:hypothetical protein
MTARAFLASSFKIGLAIFLAFVALIILVALANWAYEGYKSQAAKKFEVVKKWNVDLSAPLQMQLGLRTKLMNQTLYGSITGSGYPSFLSDTQLRSRNHDAWLKIVFNDSDGFKVFEKSIPLNEFTGVTNDQGKRVGISHDFNSSVSPAEYEKFAHFTVEWNVVTEIPAPATAKAAPRPAGQDGTDHCAPGISKAERLRRLATYGTTRETGMNTYRAGDHEVMFLYNDGTVLSCN